MSGDALDFNHIKTQAVIKSPPARQQAKANSRHSDRKFRETCTIVCHRQKLGGQFKRGDFSTCDAPRPRRRKAVNTQEIIDQINELILE